MYSDVYELVETADERERLLEEIDILINSKYQRDAVEVREKVARVLGKYAAGLDKVREAVKKMREVKLEVARDLPQKALGEICAWVRRNLGEDVVVETQLRPELIGGATVYWEGRYGDFSLRKKLEDQFLILKSQF